MGNNRMVTKCTLYVINWTFLVFGLALFGMGLYFQVDPSLEQLSKVTDVWEDEIIDQLQTGIKHASIVLIVSGVLISGLSICGCCGAMKENRCLITFYLIVVSILVFLEVGGGVLAYQSREKLDTYLTSSAKEYIMETYYTDAKDNSSEILTGAIMTKFECCGWTGPADFDNNTAISRTPQDKPLICCANAEMPDQCDADPTQFHSTGCRDRIINAVKDNKTPVKIILGLLGGVGVLEIVAIVAALIFRYQVSKETQGVDITSDIH